MMKFRIIKLLDKGGFAEVYLAKDITNNKLLALKKIDEKKLSNKEKDYLNNEIKILKLFNHINILKLYYVLKTKNNKNTILALEYCNGGSILKNLNDYMYRYGKPFPEKLVQKLMKQILIGVKALHDKGIIHRDLKLNNILLHYDNNIDLNNKNLYAATIKIIDFNISYKPNGFMPVSVVGTPENMAPTIVKNLFSGHPKIYDDKIDVWSLGTLCYEMLFGKPLFNGFTEDQIFLNILNNNFYIPNTISKQAHSFLLNMLKKDGINRSTVSQLLNHEFIIKNYNFFNMNGKGQNNNNIPIFKKININVKNILNKNNNNKNMILPLNHNNNIKKMILPLNNNNNTSSKKCNGCGQKILSGILYKCLECAEVIYCEKCYGKFKSNHLHQFQKFIRKNNLNNNNNSHNPNANKLNPVINKKNIVIHGFHFNEKPKIIQHCDTDIYNFGFW